MLPLLFAWLQNRLQKDDRGAAAVEFGLLIAAITALVASFTSFGPAVGNVINNLTGDLGSPPTTTTP